MFCQSSYKKYHCVLIIVILIEKLLIYPYYLSRVEMLKWFPDKQNLEISRFQSKKNHCILVIVIWHYDIWNWYESDKGAVLVH